MGYEQIDLRARICGSSMPIDHNPHWRLYNPLNVLIILPLLVLVLSLLTAL